MRAAIFGDIHGNAVALQAVLNDINRLGVDVKVCHGDAAFRGPEPQRSLSLLLEAGCDGLVVGNTDQWLFQGFPAGLNPPPERARMLELYREWALARLDEAALASLRSFAFSHTLSLGKEAVTVVHSSPKSTEDMYAASSSDDELMPILEGAKGDVLVCGHIHTPYARRLAGRWVINTGSVGHPFDGDPRASYVVLEAGDGGLHVQIRRVAYDVEETVKAAQKGDFPYLEQYVHAIRTGQAF